MLTPKDMVKLEDEKYSESMIIDKIDAGIRANFGKREYQFVYFNSNKGLIPRSLLRIPRHL